MCVCCSRAKCFQPSSVNSIHCLSHVSRRKGVPPVEMLTLGWPSSGRRFFPPTNVSKTKTCGLPSALNVAIASLCPAGSRAISFTNWMAN